MNCERNLLKGQPRIDRKNNNLEFQDAHGDILFHLYLGKKNKSENKTNYMMCDFPDIKLM